MELSWHIHILHIDIFLFFIIHPSAIYQFYWYPYNVNVKQIANSLLIKLHKLFFFTNDGQVYICEISPPLNTADYYPPQLDQF